MANVPSGESSGDWKLAQYVAHDLYCRSISVACSIQLWISGRGIVMVSCCLHSTRRSRKWLNLNFEADARTTSWILVSSKNCCLAADSHCWGFLGGCLLERFDMVGARSGLIGVCFQGRVLLLCFWKIGNDGLFMLQANAFFFRLGTSHYFVNSKDGRIVIGEERVFSER